MPNPALHRMRLRRIGELVVGRPMEHPENIRRFAAALAAPQPAEALYALATSFKSEGMSKEAIYDLFMVFFRRHRDDTDERLSDAISDTMDFIAHDRLSP